MDSLKLLITEAVIIDRNLNHLARRLRRLKQQIVHAAAGSPHCHLPTAGGGASWIAEGFDGCVARVSFPANALLPVIDPDTPSGSALLLWLGRRKLELFKPLLRYEPVPDFRERVRQLFDPGESSQIIAATETLSPPRVSFATKHGPQLCALPAPDSAAPDKSPDPYETAA